MRCIAVGSPRGRDANPTPWNMLDPRSDKVAAVRKIGCKGGGDWGRQCGPRWDRRMLLQHARLSCHATHAVCPADVPSPPVTPAKGCALGGIGSTLCPTSRR